MMMSAMGGGGIPAAKVNPYQNKLLDLLNNPGSFSGTPGFQFALDQGTQNVARQMAAKGMGHSGNALAEIMKYGTGLASQDYGAQRDFLGRMTGQEQQYDLGKGQLTNASNAADQQFGLGMYRAGNDLALGEQQNENTAQNNWWNYDVNQTQNANTAANNQNRFNIDWMNADTNRGNARSTDYYRGMSFAPPKKIY